MANNKTTDSKTVKKSIGLDKVPPIMLKKYAKNLYLSTDILDKKAAETTLSELESDNIDNEYTNAIKCCCDNIANGNIYKLSNCKSMDASLVGLSLKYILLSFIYALYRGFKDYKSGGFIVLLVFFISATIAGGRGILLIPLIFMYMDLNNWKKWKEACEIYCDLSSKKLTEHPSFKDINQKFKNYKKTISAPTLPIYFAMIFIILLMVSV